MSALSSGKNRKPGPYDFVTLSVLIDIAQERQRAETEVPIELPGHDLTSISCSPSV